jgi:hypothetical protein
VSKSDRRLSAQKITVSRPGGYGDTCSGEAYIKVDGLTASIGWGMRSEIKRKDNSRLTGSEQEFQQAQFHAGRGSRIADWHFVEMLLKFLVDVCFVVHIGDHAESRHCQFVGCKRSDWNLCLL